MGKTGETKADMWPFRSTKKYSWKKEHARLWEQLVPKSGQADTLQGELIRIAGKLTDQAFRNGNMNWDDDHEKMWRFVAEKITSDSTFGRRDQNAIREKVEEIIRDNECPNLDGDRSPYYFVGEKVVDWCMSHPAPIPYEGDPDLGR